MKITMILKLAMAALVVVISVAACSKKSSSDKTKTAYLTSAPWKFSQASVDLDSNGTGDLQIPAIYLQACDIDDIYTLKADNTGIADEGPTKCDPAAAQTTSFNWNLQNNDTEITFSTLIFAGVGGSAKIIELNDTRFLISKKLAVPGYAAPQAVILTMLH
jgi:hypothetical protein